MSTASAPNDEVMGNWLERLRKALLYPEKGDLSEGYAMEISNVRCMDKHVEQDLDRLSLV